MEHGEIFLTTSEGYFLISLLSSDLRLYILLRFYLAEIKLGSKMLRFSSRSYKYALNCLDLFVCSSPKYLKSARFTSTATSVKTSPKRSTVLYGIFAGIGLGAGYAFYQLKGGPEQAILNSVEKGKPIILNSFPPNIDISRKVGVTYNCSDVYLA